jgi:hypothetical protein
MSRYPKRYTQKDRDIPHKDAHNEVIFKRESWSRRPSLAPPDYDPFTEML